MPNTDAIAVANQSIQFASREAAGAAGGLMEWFLAPDTRTRRERLMEDWLDFNGLDMGYALGLLIYISSAVALIFAPSPILLLPIVISFALCWYFA
jgi:hypothetical protein